MRQSTRIRVLAYSLLIPAFLMSLGLIIYPLFMTVHLSLREGVGMNFQNLSSVSLGFANYTKVLSNPRTWQSFSRALIYMVSSTGISFVVGLLTALFLNRNLFGRRWQRMLILLPWSVPGVVASILFLWMLDGSYGIINRLLVNAGVLSSYISWYSNIKTAMVAVVWPTIWKGYPFFTITLLAAVQSVPDQLYDAARVDGATSFQQFLHVTWPGIRSAALLALILNGLWTFRVFDIIYATTQGGPLGATETIAIRIYNEAFKYFRMGQASTLGILSFVFVALVVLLLYPRMKKGFF